MKGNLEALWRASVASNRVGKGPLLAIVARPTSLYKRRREEVRRPPHAIDSRSMGAAGRRMAGRLRGCTCVLLLSQAVVPLEGPWKPPLPPPLLSCELCLWW